MNIILIGMPSSGKSTAGVLLAKTLGYGFIDTDLLIQNEQKALLCDIIAAKGAEEFLRIAPGGSAVYGERAMLHFREIGTVVYLKLSEREIERRLHNIVLRGVVMRTPGESVAQLYAERVPLYEKYAHVTVSCDGLSLEETVSAIVRAVFPEKTA